MSIINSLIIRLSCREVGKDHYGNTYYVGRSSDYLDNKKRYVVYKGDDEPSKVPPLWHAWLHYLSDEIPGNVNNKATWQQEHMPNLTGTKVSYFPQKPGHERLKVSADYNKWQPK